MQFRINMWHKQNGDVTVKNNFLKETIRARRAKMRHTPTHILRKATKATLVENDRQQKKKKSNDFLKLKI